MPTVARFVDHPAPQPVDWFRFLSTTSCGARIQATLARHAATVRSSRTFIGASLERYPIPLPALAEQRQIAGILGALDDKIELNRRMSQTLESMARALFKSWFVDFDPVRAKAEGRDPGLPK